MHPSCCGGARNIGVVGAGRDDGRKGRKDEDGLGRQLAEFHCPLSAETRGTEKLRSPQEAPGRQPGFPGVCMGSVSDRY